MRASHVLIAAAMALVPDVASASPFSVGLYRVQDPEPEPEPESDAPPFEPTSSKAPDSGEKVPEPTSQPEPLPSDPLQTEEQAEVDEDATLEGERDKAKKKEGDFNRHGVGARGGIVVIPTWILSSWLQTHTNALCRGESIGNFAEKRGVLRVDGCNFYAGGEYIYRQSRILDIIGSIGYQSAKAPDGYWLDEGEDIDGADYTEVDLSMLTIEADFIARYPVVVTDDVEFGIGGGAGIGLGIVFGGVYQTALGSVPMGFTPSGGPTDTCQTVDDLADFTRCTPRWDAGEDMDRDDGVPPDPNDLSNPNPQLFVTCSEGNCSEGDLRTLGYRRKQDDVPPVIPIVNLIISTRVIIKDTFGITLSGGWNTGFYFGGGLTYFFGKQFQKKGREGPAPEEKESVPVE